MNEQTINQMPPATWQDEDFFGLPKHKVEALRADGVEIYSAEIALRQVSATNIEHVRMYQVGRDHIVVLVDDNSGVVRWGVMRRASGEWNELRAGLNSMEVSDWGFAQAQAQAIRDSCFYSDDFVASGR